MNNPSCYQALERMLESVYELVELQACQALNNDRFDARALFRVIMKGSAELLAPVENLPDDKTTRLAVLAALCFAALNVCRQIKSDFDDAPDIHNDSNIIN